MPAGPFPDAIAAHITTGIRSRYHRSYAARCGVGAAA